MKKVFAMLFVTVPLGLAIIFIINGIVSETFPFFIEPINESKFLEQTYEAAKNYCENNKNSGLVNGQDYTECIKVVEEWFEQNPYK